MDFEPEECKESLFELGTSEIDIDTKRFESVDADPDLFQHEKVKIEVVQQSDDFNGETGASVVDRDDVVEPEEFEQKRKVDGEKRASFWINKIDDALKSNTSDNSEDDMQVQKQSFGGNDYSLADVKELEEVKNLYSQLDEIRQDVVENEEIVRERRSSQRMTLDKLKTLIGEVEKTNDEIKKEQADPFGVKDEPGH